MEDRSLKVPKHLDGTKKFVQVIGKPGLGITVGGIREHVDLRLTSLRLWWKARIHVEVSVP